MSFLQKIKTNKTLTMLLLLLVVSVVLNLIFFGEYQGLRNRIFYQHTSVPDIELGNLMGFYGLTVLGGETIKSRSAGIIAFGEINGFVAFFDESNQPRELRQYYSVDTTDELDKNGNQIFSVTETLKMTHVSERETEPELFYVVQNSDREFILESDGGARIKIDKRTGMIVLDDGEAYLITRDVEFGDFMTKMYK